MKDSHYAKKLDTGTVSVIVVTFGLFLLAIFMKGIGKDLLLEAGVLMVSVKLIMMSFKNAAESQAIREDLDRIVELLAIRSNSVGAQPTQEAMGN
jgi:hypothetical protein